MKTPNRSATILTASTLVAENGSDEDLDTAVSDKLLRVIPEWEATETPTESAVSAEAALGAFQITGATRSTSAPSTPKISSVLSAVRRSSRISYFSKTRKSRLSSPSQSHLLHSNNGAETPSESEADDEHDDVDYEDADFYAQDARGAVGGVRSSIMSFVGTQSDARTLIRERSEDDEHDFPRIQIPSWLLSTGNMSFATRSDSLHSDPVTRSDSAEIAPSMVPHRQFSQDTQSTLPPYTSRTVPPYSSTSITPPTDVSPPFPYLQ